VDHVEMLIQAFRSEQPSGLFGDALPGKVDVVEDLAAINDDRILPFFLAVLTDTNEYDEARLGVLDQLQFRRYTSEERAAVANAVIAVMLHDPDNNVRRHAAMTLQDFMDVLGTVDAVGHVLLKPDEDVDLRHSALRALGNAGAADRAMEILRALRSDERLGEYAQSTLNIWRDRRS